MSPFFMYFRTRVFQTAEAAPGQEFLPLRSARDGEIELGDRDVSRGDLEDYFGILDDLLLGVRLPVFSRRAKRKIVAHPKFFFFDVGVYRALRPRGPLDTAEEIEGAAFETLLFQELRALNAGLSLGYQTFYWRTGAGQEVDFVLYGDRGLKAFEVKRSARVRPEDLRGLQRFLDDYPIAEAWLVYGGTKAYRDGRIRVLPLGECLQGLADML